MDIQSIVNGNVNGATFIGIDTVTNVKLAGGRKNPHQGKITKHTTGSSVMVFQNKKANGYANMVSSRLEKEGKDPDFKLAPRRWGERIPNTPFVKHGDKLYLEVIFLKCGVVEYHIDGILSDCKDVEGMPNEQRESSHTQNGLENKVIIRAYGVDSIHSIAINKERYDLK